ncbi:hypothetical protein [Spirosoma sordidisoli]|uniref:Uncharacterized protein n=1 Tax=Spirosoma sordidisoli TaxID=2502893 RepID=A0A4Q2UV19_9BACT|nr:hypothetical protein [Spirosoma sordidisoli]RYC70759.1 hypothetical protein EQG79_00980 [Spirosoma sordidisoli]
MPKVSTERIVRDKGQDTEFIFQYDVNVTKDGVFSTTLPSDVASRLELAGISLAQNRLGNKGYIESKTFDELIKRVRDIVDLYFSKELISEKIIIRYAIRTTCAYVLDKDGNIAPNGTYSPLGGAGWINGTVPQHASSPMPYGILAYCKPFVRRDYLYKNGKIKTEFVSNIDWRTDDLLESGVALKWLNDLCSICPPDNAPVQEIDYTEPVAAFFVQLIKSLCAINEKIKDFLDPVSIKTIAESNGRLLD